MYTFGGHSRRCGVSSSVLRWGGARCHCHSVPLPVRLHLVTWWSGCQLPPLGRYCFPCVSHLYFAGATLRLCQYSVPHYKLFLTDFSIHQCFLAAVLLCWLWNGDLVHSLFLHWLPDVLLEGTCPLFLSVLPPLSPLPPAVICSYKFLIQLVIILYCCSINFC